MRCAAANSRTPNFSFTALVRLQGLGERIEEVLPAGRVLEPMQACSSRTAWRPSGLCLLFAIACL